jgi:cell division protein FtsZ
MALIESDMDDLKYEIEEEAARGTRIKVVGVGGGGCNAVARMVAEKVEGVEFHALNTDARALAVCNVPNKLQIGTKVTRGLGAGANPDVGRQAALENTDDIVELLQGSDMVFVTAGLGGGTGTGAAPVIASLSKELDALTVAVVTRPFGFEGPRRMRVAEQGLGKLASTVDTVITIPNERLLSLLPKGTSFFESLRVADDLLRQAVQGISDIITTPGLINRDFSDVRTIMSGMGYAMMGTAVAQGENAAVAAAEKAIACPLLEAGGVAGARGVLVNITGSRHLRLHEVNQACTLIRKACANEDVEVNFGVVVDDKMGDEVKVTVIATGFQRENLPVIHRKTTSTSAAANIYVPPAPAPAPPIASAPPPVFVMEEEDLDAEEIVYAEAEVDAAALEAEAQVAAAARPEKFRSMAAAANALPPQAPVNGHTEPLLDELEVPAILRRERRFLH